MSVKNTSALRRLGILWDSFRTVDPAPVANPRVASPGPGLCAITDTENKFSVSGGDLVCAGGKAVPAFGDPSIALGRDNAGSAATHAIGPGIGGYWALRVNTRHNVYLSLSSVASGAGPEPRFYMGSDGSVQISSTPSGAPVVATLSNGDEAKFLIVQRSATHGQYMILNGALLWADEPAVTDPAYVYVSNNVLAADYHDLALVDLSSYGFTNDFLDVTDTKTNPASGTTYDHDSDFHMNLTFTVEDTKYCIPYFRQVDGNNGWYLAIGDNRVVSISRGISGVWATQYTGDTLTDGVAYEFDLVCEGGTIKLYQDKVLKTTISDTTHQTATGGTIYHTLATNDIVLTTHPYPALGIATDRVVCPQLNDTATHESDCVIVLKNIQLGVASDAQLNFRDAGSNDYMKADIFSDGRFHVYWYDGGVYQSALIEAGAATVSNGDDAVIIVDGSSLQVFINGTSIGTSGSAPWPSGTGASVSQLPSGFTFDYIAFSPRYPSLPAELT